MNAPSILFENEHYVSALKPAWWLTHPSNEARHIKENLMSYVRDQLELYVYPINRLDLQSSGIVLFGKHPEAVTKMQAHWHGEYTTKRYIALVHGKVAPQGEFNFSLNDENKRPKNARTLYRTLQYYVNASDVLNASLVEVEIKTGRRHQIRRHFSRRMHALIGDRKYGKKIWNDPFRDKFGLNRLFLHASFLKFQDPYSLEVIEINSALPLELQKVLDQMHSNLV